MEAGCTVEGYLPSLCASTALTSYRWGYSPSGTRYRDMASHREQSGRKSRSLPSSPTPIWSVACVSWLRVAVVTLATTI
jgi:hypothetical protein